MVAILHALIISYLVIYAQANFTRISKNNVLLSRKRRYLTFPMGSNLVMTMSFVKAFLQVQPRGYNTILEVDVPFALPSNATFFYDKKKKKKKHQMERRSVYSQLDAALTGGGLNGTACVNRIVCDVQQYIPLKGKSLVKDLLLAVFTSPDSDEVYGGKCDENSFTQCEFPLLDFILNSVQTHHSEV